MINKCPNCNSTPSQNGYIKCVNDNCENYNIDHLAPDWQALTIEVDSLCEQGSAACIESLDC